MPVFPGARLPAHRPAVRPHRVRDRHRWCGVVGGPPGRSGGQPARVEPRLPAERPVRGGVGRGAAGSDRRQRRG